MHEFICSVISLEESILFDGFTPGRRSFRGFNPLIEALTTERQAEDLVSQARKESDESDQPIESFSNMRKRPEPSQTDPRIKSKTAMPSKEKARQIEQLLMPKKDSSKNKTSVVPPTAKHKSVASSSSSKMLAGKKTKHM